MATRYWYGNAKAVAQVNTLTPTAANSQTYTITINGKTCTYTADASATVAEITAGLVAAFATVDEPEFAELTAADGTTVVTITANTAGVPFTQTSSASGGGALVTATTTASAGPNDASSAANWSSATAPVSTDDVVVGPGTVSILYGLDYSAVNLASFTVMAGYTGQIGLPDYNTAGYREYRNTSLALGTATLVDIGQGDGSGMGFCRLNLGTNAATVTIRKLGSPAQQGLPALLLQGSNAANVLHAYSGTIGLAVNKGETAQFPTINAGFVDSQTSDVLVVGGSGLAAVTTVTQSGGVVDLQSNVTTWSQVGGNGFLRGTATLGTHNFDSGYFTHLSSGTLTTLNLGDEAIWDASRDQRAKTVTNCYASSGARILAGNRNVTWTNGVNIYRAGVQSGARSKGLEVDFGEHIRITPGAYS